MKTKCNPDMLLDDFFSSIYLPMRLTGASKATIQQIHVATRCGGLHASARLAIARPGAAG